MTDLAMCSDHACPSRHVCVRYWPPAWGEPNPRQAFADMERKPAATVCNWFVEQRNIDGGER